jgi:predicted GTPase
LGKVIPAMGYNAEQCEDLRQTLERVDCDLIVSATPVDLGQILRLDKPLVQVSYDFVEKSPGALAAVIREFLDRV